MKTILIMFLALSLSACNDSGGSSAATDKVVTPVSDPVDLVQNPADIDVVYYTLTKTRIATQMWINKTYNVSGACAEIQGATFCWSDGLKISLWESNNVWYGPYQNNYFFVHTSNGRAHSCNGGCNDDYMQTPKQITTQLLNLIPQSSIDEIFNTGSRMTMKCRIESPNLVCGSLVFRGQ